MVTKDQEEQEKPASLEPNMVLPDITLLINERDYLKEELRTLREHFENENVRYTELKSLKYQQVCALTFKLAKAIRDKERALQERDEINKKYIFLQNRNEELDVQNATLQETLSAFEREYTSPDSQTAKKVLPSPKMSCFAVTGVLKSGIDHGNNKTIEVEENPTVDDGEPKMENHTMDTEADRRDDEDGEPKMANHTMDTETDRRDDEDDGEPGRENQTMETQEDKGDDHTIPGMNNLKFESDDEKEHFLAEFRNIQKELSDVKKNMSIVQCLNEKLSGNLEFLGEIRRTPAFLRSLSERSRKNACSSFTDYTDGKKEHKMFIFPDVSNEQNEMKDLGSSGEELSLTPSKAQSKDDGGESFGERRQMEVKKSQIMEDHGISLSPENCEIDFKKQLEKAMKELEDIRTDNREMKLQINHMEFSTLDHKDFLRRTTDFTGEILKEMKDREEQRSRKTSVESQASPQPPLSILGTRLDEIIKAVDDMTYEPDVTPKECPVALAARPHSAGIPANQSAFTPVVLPQEAPKNENAERSTASQKRRNIVHGKLSDASLYDRSSLTSGIAGFRKISEPLPKEWRSTEALSYKPKPTSFSSSLGYKDYIHRHIVMSSSAIAKIRDLKPEELGHTEQHFIY